jgi:hypothetical protein
MKTRYRLICRGTRSGAYSCVDTKTGQRTSLGTTNADDARQIIEAKNNAERQAVLNLQIARAYLAATDRRPDDQVDTHLRPRGRAINFAQTNKIFRRGGCFQPQFESGHSNERKFGVKPKLAGVASLPAAGRVAFPTRLIILSPRQSRETTQ